MLYEPEVWTISQMLCNSALMASMKVMEADAISVNSLQVVTENIGVGKLIRITYCENLGLRHG